ncbi:MAG TPA: THUMP domain-containing protein [Nitrososphaerales archaeon]|jgi:tRNA acetyltransferase TAN1|nr:THUMP domain-containing protein [Nitrososphaerales archaeon]|tara:strand:+ start:1432 stop:1962 length:531 start_codon:yes stop_codon:yes gene_type:complete
MVVKNTFILTTFKGGENTAGSEVYTLLAEFGDSKAKISRTEVSGILLVETVLSHQEVIETLKKIIEDEPWRVRSMLRIFPIEQVIETNIEEIVGAIQPILEKIGEDETFRVTVEKRQSDLSRKEIIDTIASKITRKVDLENPNWVVLVEVIGNKTGVSVINPSHIISVTKSKRGTN